MPADAASAGIFPNQLMINPVHTVLLTMKARAFSALTKPDRNVSFPFIRHGMAGKNAKE